MPPACTDFAVQTALKMAAQPPAAAAAAHAAGASEPFDMNKVKTKALCSFDDTAGGSTATLESLKDWAPQGLDMLLDGTDPDKPLVSMFTNPEHRDHTNRQHLTAEYIKYSDPAGTTAQKTVHYLDGEYAKRFRSKYRGNTSLESFAYHDDGSPVYGLSEIVFTYQTAYYKTKPTALDRA